MMSLVWTLLLQLLPLLLLCYLYVSHKYSFWRRRNVAGPRAVFPLGYQFQKALADPIEIEHRWSRQYGSVYGVYTGLIPTLTITDKDLIKQVLVRDFHLFADRRELNSSHEIWNQNLFNLDARNWKRIRSITSCAFTSSKLKNMYPLMNECVTKLVNYMERATSDGDAIADIKQVVTGFTIDVIASTSFATDTNTNGGDPAEPNSFVQNGVNLFKLNPLRVAAVYALPRWLLQSIGIKTIFADQNLEFFVNLCKSVIQNRKAVDHEVKRNDLVQLMMDAFVYEKELKSMTNYDQLTAVEDSDESQPEYDDFQTNRKKQTLSEMEIIAQCMIFFVAGFETTAATLSHAIFMMVNNPDVQERLSRELSAIRAEFPEEMSQENVSEYCDKVLKLPYLEAVIKETLRMFPPLVRIERRLAVNNYKIAGIPLERDVLVEVPVISVHYNEEYYPEPDKFNPERFMPENKHLLVPYTFLPFGAGPRNCIGMRFAFQEMKLALAAVCNRFHFAPTDNTPNKLEFLKGSIMLNSKSFPVKVSKRR